MLVTMEDDEDGHNDSNKDNAEDERPSFFVFQNLDRLMATC